MIIELCILWSTLQSALQGLQRLYPDLFFQTLYWVMTWMTENEAPQTLYSSVNAITLTRTVKKRMTCITISESESEKRLP